VSKLYDVDEDWRSEPADEVETDDVATAAKEEEADDE
jgi:hypothetical protein